MPYEEKWQRPGGGELFAELGDYICQRQQRAGKKANEYWIEMAVVCRTQRRTIHRKVVTDRPAGERFRARVSVSKSTLARLSKGQAVSLRVK